MNSVDVQFQLPARRRPPRRKAEPKQPPPRPIPRLTRLLALAIKFEKLLADGVVRDYADLARLGRVTRARMTQIMRLLDLAPDIQEAILIDQPAVTEREIRSVSRLLDWDEQRRTWRSLVETKSAPSGDAELGGHLGRSSSPPCTAIHGHARNSMPASDL